MPYDTRVLETGTTFVNETDGVWTLADWTGDGRHQDLIFIKTSNTGTGRVEVHVASGASTYRQRIWESGSTFLPETDGTWMMADFTGDGKLDLIYIKTAHCGSCRVEVHVASAASGYQTRVFEGPTAFLPRNDGTWTMADTTGDGKLDLIFIQTSHTNFGKVEVHIASGASDYGQLILNTTTAFDNDNGGTWLLTPFDQTHNHVQDLVFIKAGPNIISDRVEIIEADKDKKGSGSAYGERTFASDSTFVPESDGTWCMANYSHADRPDLVFIKTANTPSGTVEVHIAKY